MENPEGMSPRENQQDRGLMETSKGMSPRENQQGEGLMENPEGVSPKENQQDEDLLENPIIPFFQSLGESIEEEIHPAILHAIILLIPVNIYVIGDRVGAGIQWPLFR